MRPLAASVLTLSTGLQWAILTQATHLTYYWSAARRRPLAAIRLPLRAYARRAQHLPPLPLFPARKARQPCQNYVAPVQPDDMKDTMSRFGVLDIRRKSDVDEYTIISIPLAIHAEPLACV